jgi:threonine synthase
VLYPRGQVTPLQERQFTTLGGNVQALAVAGAFDDCQRLVKAAFADPDLRRALRLTSANSINFGRLLPQVVYYFHAVAQLPAGAPPPRFVVPSGNFGNLTAGLLAQRLGLRTAGFVAATNVNDAVPEYLATGRFRPRPSVRTISSAMDVGDPSNFARVLHLYGGDVAALRRDLAAFRFDDDETRAALREVYRATGYLLDPHSAVGWLALRADRADRAARAARGEPTDPATPVLLATAHPAKFREVIEPVIGEEIPLPPRLAACLDRPGEALPLAASSASLADFLTGW